MTSPAVSVQFVDLFFHRSHFWYFVVKSWSDERSQAFPYVFCKSGSLRFPIYVSEPF